MKTKLLIILSIFIGLNFSSKADNSDKNEFQKTIEYADRAFEALDFSDAIKYYNEALRIKPSKRIHMKLADCYQKIHEPEKAITEIEKAMQIESLNKAEIMMYGEVLIDAGEYDKAYEVLKDYVDESYWVEKKMEGIRDLDAFFQYEEGYQVKTTPFSTAESEFSPAFYEGGLVIVASRNDKNPFSPKYNWDDSGYLDFFYVNEENEVKKMHKKLNTQYHEGPAVFYDNDQKVIFTRNQFEANNGRIPGEKVNHLKLFYSEKKANGKWKSPKMLPFNVPGYSFGHPAINDEGTELYFASNMEGGLGGTDLYKVTFDGNEWSAPVSLGKGINTEKDEQFPFYYEGNLYFASNGMQGLGGLDIFKVDLSGDREPANLGAPFNTRYDDFGLILSPSENKGYFSSNREGGSGKDDIYEFSRVEQEINIKLLDEETGEPVTGNIRVMETAEKNLFGEVKNVSNYQVRTIRGARLIVTASADGYTSSATTFDTRSVPMDDTQPELELKLKALETLRKLYVVVKNGDVISQQLSINADGSSPELMTDGTSVDFNFLINQIYYDFGEAEVKETFFQNLDQLAEVLLMNNDLSVTLVGYADPTGDEQYNLRLSEKRAQAAGDYLVMKGISSDRLVIEGKGEIEATGDCIEECLQSYRRTEIEIAIEH